MPKLITLHEYNKLFPNQYAAARSLMVKTETFNRWLNGKTWPNSGPILDLFDRNGIDKTDPRKKA